MNSPSAPGVQARWLPDLPPEIDRVAEAAAESHRFLRRAWFAAAVATYGGPARTLLVEAGAPALALPLVPLGPRALGIVQVPGSYWPFRSPVAAADASSAVFRAAVAALRGRVRGVRIGPVADGDPGVDALVAAAGAAGWRVLARQVATSWVLDMAAVEEPWPRNSTLRKNRFHEKHLGAHGLLDWSYLTAGDWPGGFDALAAVEGRAWVAGAPDAKFEGRHGGFWRAAAADPVLAGMIRAALLRVDGVPAAFSFDVEVGARCYAVANSYDPAFAKHSPGKLLQYRNLVDARARGVRVVDWGAGDSGYKQTLGAVEGPRLRDWLLLAPGPLGALAARLARGWRRVAV